MNIYMIEFKSIAIGLGKKRLSRQAKALVSFAFTPG
jgi:hypothetical protein